MIPISTTSTSDITEITSTDCVRSDGMMTVEITNTTSMYGYDYDIWVTSVYKEKLHAEHSNWHNPQKIGNPKKSTQQFQNYRNRNSLPIKFRND